MPEVALWYRLRAEVFLQEEKTQPAIADLQKALTLEADANTVALLGKTLLAANRVEEARRLMDAWETQLKDNPQLLAIQAAIYAAAGDKPKAKASFDTAMNLLQGKSSQVGALVGQVQASIDPGFLTELLRPWASRDETGQISFLMAQILLQDKDSTAEAIVHLENAQTKTETGSPNWFRLQHMLAIANQNIGDYIKASDIYEAILEKKSDDFIALNNLACVYTDHVLKPDLAVKYASRALDLAKKDPKHENIGNLLDTLGWAQFKAGKLDEAKLNLQQSVRQEPEVTYNRYHLAEVLLAKGMQRDVRLQIRLIRRIAEKKGETEMLNKVEELEAKLQ
jgi:tetratricopeptide (TPR) repeat protein